MKIINPATGKAIANLVKDTRESVEKKYRQAVETQATWASEPLEKRLACIRKFYDLVEGEKEELAKTLTSEVGKPLKQSYNELNGARQRIKFFTDNSSRWLADEWITT